MNRTHLFVLVGLILFTPLMVFAAWVPGDSLVPDEVLRLVTGEKPNPAGVTACNLVQLFDNLLAFAVYASALIATIMFVYAGFLYVTAAARPDNLNQAKGIFGKVFLGFIIILAAWLIVDILLTVLTKEKQGFAFWSNIDCVQQQLTVPVGGVGGVITGPAPLDSSLEGGPGGFAVVAPSATLDHPTALARLENRNVKVTSTSGDGGVQQFCSGSGCTSLENMREVVVDTTGNLQESCGSGCQVTVTAGTEKGVHRPGSISHETGWRIDYDDDNAVFNDFIENSGKFKKIQDRNGDPQYRDRCGNTYVRESDHWDATIVQVCSF